jgi:tetratricopeptide (TPR) repeat protein
MTLRLLPSLVLLPIAGAAPAAVTVFGTDLARQCYEAVAFAGSSVADVHTCTQALGREPLTRFEEVATLVNRGILKKRLGDLDGAIKDYDEALKRDPDEAEAWLNKAVALLALPERARQALPAFSAAIEKGTRRPDLAHFGRAIAHERAGDARAAYSDYRQASLLAPGWEAPMAELKRFRVRN